MKRAIDIAGLVLRICASLALLALALLCAQVREIADKEANNLDSIAQHAVAVEQDADDTINALRPAAVAVPKLVNDARLTLDNTNKAAIDERMYFEQEVPGLMARVNSVVDQTGATLAAYQKTGEALTAAAQGLQPVELSTTKSITDLDTLIANPHWQTTLANIDAASQSTASTAKHLDGTAADTQEAVHKFLHPTWGTRIVNWIAQAAHTAGGWF